MRTTRRIPRTLALIGVVSLTAYALAAAAYQWVDRALGRVHALRAAFAVFYLSRNPGDLKGLQELLGHSNIATTAIYLRKLEKATAMEPVRGLSWKKPERHAA